MITMDFSFFCKATIGMAIENTLIYFEKQENDKKQSKMLRHCFPSKKNVILYNQTTI